MPNEEYQRLLRADAPELRRRLEVDTDDLDDTACSPPSATSAATTSPG